MSNSDSSLPLTGGNVNSQVVRIGDTVRRRTGPHSSAVQRWLLHLEKVGFSNAPRYMGRDTEGREILSYIPGSGTMPDNPGGNDHALIRAAHMLRQMHDASAGFDQQGKWAFCYPDRDKREVICHNDFAPYNMIWVDGLPVGIVDFDLAGPGPRLRDLAYLAYWMVPLSCAAPEMRCRARTDLANGSTRLRLLCDTYGAACDSDLLDMVSEVLHHMGDPVAVAKMVGSVAAKRLADGGHFTHWQGEAAAFDIHRPHLV